MSFAKCLPFDSSLNVFGLGHETAAVDLLPGFAINLQQNQVTSTPIHARAWKEKALAGYNSQQILTNNDIHKMLIIIISLRWKHFVIMSYLHKIPTINESYNQRKRDIRQTHTDILTA